MRSIRVLLALASVALFACGDNNDAKPDAQAGPPCSDGIDNDGDGMTDFPDDLGCDSTTDDTEDSAAKPQCQDNRDNDGDGKTDFPNDPGCPATLADDENDNCPNDPNCPQCGDGKDNDGNGKTDFPEDATGCMSAADLIEFTDDPNACGQGMVIKPLPTNGQDMGALVGTVSNVSSPCGGGNALPAVAYIIHLASPKVIVASTDDPMTAIDTVLDLRTSMCSAPTAEVACHDDILPTGTLANKKSKITKSLNAGTYYLIVGGKTAADTGMYLLDVDLLPGEGASCATVADCGPGLECRIPTGQTQMVCTGPVCDDLRDDDADGKIDYPNDPGCTSPTDDTETDVCNTTPTSPLCPECSNTVDDDGDGKTDYPMDTACKSAASSSEACVVSEAVTVVTMPTMMGTTVGAVNDYTPTCAGSSANAPDVTLRLDLPAMATLNTNLTGFDTVQVLLDSTCAGTAIACSDPPLLTRTNVAAGTYYLVADGYGTNSGAWTLATSGTVAVGGSCEGALFQSGAFTCTTGYACRGTMGSRTCQLSVCNDTMDNDADGKTDYPVDPGCASTSDNDEADDCSPTIGPNCPVCSDTIDNDMDGTTDYPMDPSCISASGTSEACNQSESLIVATTPTVTGTTVGAVNDFRPPAGSVNGHLCSTTTDSSATAPDVGVQLDVPSLASLSLTLSPVSYDSTQVLLNSSCGGTAIECYDNPTGMNLTNIAAGRYFLIIDGYSGGSGTFTLNISGKINGGQSCESPLAQSGALTCAPGYQCGGTMGSRTCLPAACNDAADNDGDGKMDYPADPGCSSPSDTTEADDCFPTIGPNCPACANGMDDDMDMMTDYPMDNRCVSASFFVENFCPIETNIGTVIESPATFGTLATAADDYDQACQSTTGNDMSFGLHLPVPVATLVIDTLGSGVSDTVVSLWNVACSTSLGCDDDSDPNGLLSVLSVSNVAAGDYAIQVDAYSTSNNGPIRLNVRGTVAAGTACTSPLFTSGVLVCPMGTTCTSGMCQ